MEGVVHTVVKDVKGERAGDDTIGDGLGEDQVGELGKGSFEDEEQGRGHDETQAIHR